MTRARIGSTAVVLALVAALLQADYKESYRKGIQAIDRGDWPQAVAALRQAIAEQPGESAARVNISGGRWEPYLPHYYLGVALASLKTCGEALSEFGVSESQAVVTKLGEYKTLTRRRAACETEMAAAKKPAGAPAPQAPVPAAPAAQVLTPQPPPNQPADAGAAGARAPTAPVPGPPAAGPPTAGTETAGATSPAAPAASRAPAAPPPAVAAPAVVATPRPAPAPDLLRAAGFFFKGRYREALAALPAGAEETGAVGVQKKLFRAASLYALYVVGGERDARLRDEAAAAARDCRRLEPAYAPDPAVFSPRFIAFYRQAQ